VAIVFEANSIQLNFILPLLHANIYKAHVMQARQINI
jgi:hypothetical protein